MLVSEKRGKKPNQKLKPYLVQQYLLKYTDEDHTASAYDIVSFLEYCGIAAERRSIYRDIQDINKVMWLMDNKSADDDGIDIEAAEEALPPMMVIMKKSSFTRNTQRRTRASMCVSGDMMKEIFGFWRSACILQNFFPKDKQTVLQM